MDDAAVAPVSLTRSMRDTRGGDWRGTAEATSSLPRVSASEIWRFTCVSCRQSAAAMRHRLSRSVMKIGSEVVSRRGEKTSSGTHSGVRPVSAISAAARPAAVV